MIQEGGERQLFVRVDIWVAAGGNFRILYDGFEGFRVSDHLEGEVRPLITHVTMKAMEEMLFRRSFYAVHRSISWRWIRLFRQRNNCGRYRGAIIHVDDAAKASVQRLSESCSTFLNLDAHSKRLYDGHSNDLQCPL
ncbi:MAG: hypothetical protein ACLRO3_21885 [Parabacteroides distasonis]